MPSDNFVPIIVILLISLLSLFYVFGSSEPVHNEGALQTPNQHSSSTYYQDEESESQESADSDSFYSKNSENTTAESNSNMNDSSDSSLEIIDERARGRNNVHFNRVLNGEYKHSSYKDINSGFSKSVDNNFSVADVAKNYTDRFQPMDEAGENAAPINIQKRKETDADKYNSNAFLPNEEHKDWFETIETVNVKNSHLINIYRPIGVNTIGNTHKISYGYDIRGNSGAIAPKFVVSPWLQSTVEPDRSMKSLC